MDFLLSPDPGLLIWTVISFAILYFLLKKYAWKPILYGLKVRGETIEQSLLEAEKAKNDVKEMSITRQRMIDEAKKERDNLLKDTRALKDTILAEAKESAQKETKRLLDKARAQIEAEKFSAMKELKDQVADMSIQIAGLIINKEIKSDSEQKELVDKYLDKANFN